MFGKLDSIKLGRMDASSVYYRSLRTRFTHILLRISKDMSGVWVFDNGVLRLVQNPGSDSCQGSARRKVLIHVPTNEVVTSYDVLERILSRFGWERYYNDPELLQFHKRSTVHLISLPKDFNKLKSMHMYDIVVKNRNMFEVRDMYLN
ncbi:hypothetical protein QVD17_40639 [Tagetes erecta]|uniref:Flowering-promoting factor 1-like protein 3 n=1 Tax=Tagetes erecta TaxID=13708 RepID=A0AAD8JS59_TARER|nr:hypothetical protein QVD17_40639 [Tagetes erecta]